MKIYQFIALCIAIFVSKAAAQSIYVPSGSSGIGTSSTGNVGIGISTPGAKLTVFGSPLGSSNGSVAKLFSLENANSNYSYLMFSQIRTSDGTGWDTSTTRIQQITDASKQGYMDFNPKGGGWGLAFGTGDTEVMRLTQSGRIGLGITTPIQKLDVSGGVHMGQGAENISNTTNGLSVQDSGGQNVAIAVGSGTSRSAGIVWYDGSPGSAVFYTFGYAAPITIAARDLHFSSGGSERMTLATNGNFGIGTTTPSNKLEVNGTIRAKEVVVETTGWPDYVFSANYSLPSLSETEAHIRQHGHLPGVPSASEVEHGGVSVGEMQAKLLAKIEELTLHQIELQKEVMRLQKRVAELEE